MDEKEQPKKETEELKTSAQDPETEELKTSTQDPETEELKTSTQDPETEELKTSTQDPETEELKTSTQDPETQQNQPEGNERLMQLQKKASVESSETGGSGSRTDSPSSNQKSTDSPGQNQTIASGFSFETEENFPTSLPSENKEKAGDSGLVTTDPSTESNGGKKAESSGVNSFPTSGSLNDTTPGSSKDSPAAGKSDKTPSPDQYDPKVLDAVVPPPSVNTPAQNLPEDAIEMEDIKKQPPPPPGENPPPTAEGGEATAQSGPHPSPIEVPEEDAYSEKWDFGCLSIICLLFLAFLFAALSPVIGLLVSQWNNNSTETATTNGTNATYSNETFDNASYAVGAVSQFFTTVLYDVLSSNNRT